MGCPQKRLLRKTIRVGRLPIWNIVDVLSSRKLGMERHWFKLDPYRRYQNGLHVEYLFPKKKGYCGCCGKECKRRWCSSDCSFQAVTHMKIIKGDIRVIREQLFAIDHGACRKCGEITQNWHADHIIPVHKGGGACTLDNFQTLCVDCHKEKTLADMQADLNPLHQ